MAGFCARIVTMLPQGGLSESNETPRARNTRSALSLPKKSRRQYEAGTLVRLGATGCRLGYRLCVRRSTPIRALAWLVSRHMNKGTSSSPSCARPPPRPTAATLLIEREPSFLVALTSRRSCEYAENHATRNTSNGRVTSGDALVARATSGSALVA